MKKTGPLPKLLGLIFVVFIGIMVGVYLVARSVNPVMLDEHGDIRR